MKLFELFHPKKKRLVISQYSSLPRYFEISRKNYDLDNPESVSKLPMFDKKFEVFGREYTMAVYLREYAYEARDKNYDLYIAALAKALEYERYTGSLNQHPAKPKYRPNNVISIDHMDGYQFEEWCADLLRKLKFENVCRNGKSGDQGVDILAEKDGVKYAIQCKCYSADLGNTPVQEIYAGKNFYNCHVGAVMTNRRFTSGGQELANSAGILLWDRDWLNNAQAKVKNLAGAQQSKVQFKDELTPKAAEFVIDCGIATVDILQFGFNLGYARAARIIDEMEELGIIGPFQGSKPRDILITTDEWEYIQKSL